MFLAATPAALVKENNNSPYLLPGVFSKRLWNKLRKFELLVKLGQNIQWLISFPFRWVRLDYLYRLNSNGKKVLFTEHYFATLSVLVIFHILLILLILIAPIAIEIELTPIIYVYILLVLFIWTLGFFDFHLRRVGISVTFGLILVLSIIHVLGPSSQHFAIVQDSSKTSLSLKDIAESSIKQSNLVVVTATGGGITSAVWTTRVLESLVDERPKLLKEIRLLSTVSGGSVGASHYINSIYNSDLWEKDFCKDFESNEVQALKVLKTAYKNAEESSLAAVTFGFAFHDAWSLPFGGLIDRIPWPINVSRGALLEERWSYIANKERRGSLLEKGWLSYIINIDNTYKIAKLRNEKQNDILLNDKKLVSLIKKGCLPVPIINTTAMETGSRIMITPMDFVQKDTINLFGINQQKSTNRASTLFEYLSEEQQIYTIGLWTAARLSATFPYVSPAVSAEVWPESASKPKTKTYKHHFIDGGYYDNYGVSSALDWLNEILKVCKENRRNCNLENILILQIRSSSQKVPKDVDPVSEFEAMAFGPLVGILNVRDRVALSRNDIELARFIEDNTKLLELLSIDIQTQIITPKVDIKIKEQNCEPEIEDYKLSGVGNLGPLSWHLTEREKKKLCELVEYQKTDWVNKINNFLNSN